MWFVLAIPAALAGLVLLVVLMPFRARARGSVRGGEPAGTARVDWALGLVAVELAPWTGALRVAGIPVARFPLGGARERAEKDERRGARERRRPARRRGRRGGLRAVLAEREAFLAMAARLVRALHLRLRASGRVGTGDPADTAALGAAAAALGRLPGVELALGLDFLEEAVDVDVELSAQLWIAELLAVAALLLLVPEHRRALRAAFSRARSEPESRRSTCRT